MSDGDIRTPVTLSQLDDDHAVFVGSAQEERTINLPFGGTAEMAVQYPRVVLQRDVWEALGRPTEYVCILEAPPGQGAT